MEECLKLTIQKLVQERTWRLEDECGGSEVSESIDKLKNELREEFSKILKVPYYSKKLVSIFG